MQLVLNNEVRRAHRAVRLRFHGRQSFALVVGHRVVDVRRAEPVARAHAVHLTEQHLGFSLPRHLCELVHRGDQQGG